ncbi:hypothetical protein AAC387_Pa04g2476 [Persea americana]
MKSSTIFKTVSFRIPARFSPVAPWPIGGEFDRWLGEELDNLHPGGHRVKPCTSATWVLRALNMAVATQRKTMELIAARADTFRGSADRKWIDDYLNNLVELLDACNSIRERIATVMKYTESVSFASHSLGGGRVLTESALIRARVALSSCESMERVYELDRCAPSLRKLGEKLAQGVALSACGVAKPCSDVTQCSSELQEALRASKSVTLLVCGLLSISLSFRSKRGLPATQLTQSRKAESWSNSLHELQKLVKEEVDKQRKGGGPVLDELRSTVVMVRDLRGLIQRPADEVSRSELRGRVESLGRSCGVLEEGIKMFEGRVNELYKHLISIRMALLGVLTMA